jgi:hypothetical protein
MERMADRVPEALRTLFWDVDPDTIRLPEHADYVIERVMSRGPWNAMRWLRTAFDEATLTSFLRRKGDRLAPRERAYWSLVLRTDTPQARGGGRPAWAGS